MRATSARVVALVVGLAVVVLGVVLALNIDGGASAEGDRFRGGPAPAFEVETLSGEPLALEDLAGKTVVVNFWNTWCIPCEQEAPELAAFWDRHAGDGDVVMVGIVRDDTEAAVREYVDAREIGWTIAFDPESKAALAYGTTGQPETYVIDPQGVVVREVRGPLTAAQLEGFLAEARGLA